MLFLYIANIKDWTDKPGRCFSMDLCKQNPNGCESFNQTSSLEDLKEKCSKDEECAAVSCDVNEAKDTMCNRYMLSNKCDNSTIQEKEGWTYHLKNQTIDSGNKMTTIIFQ